MRRKVKSAVSKYKTPRLFHRWKVHSSDQKDFETQLMTTWGHSEQKLEWDPEYLAEVTPYVKWMTDERKVALTCPDTTWDTQTKLLTVRSRPADTPRRFRRNIRIRDGQYFREHSNCDDCGIPLKTEKNGESPKQMTARHESLISTWCEMTRSPLMAWAHNLSRYTEHQNFPNDVAGYRRHNTDPMVKSMRTQRTGDESGENRVQNWLRNVVWKYYNF